jgi:hypothetical protein
LFLIISTNFSSSCCFVFLVVFFLRVLFTFCSSAGIGSYLVCSYFCSFPA